ncbi:MAG TPA: CocE/NonD family hydrolase [Solirubrobacteraceae bacterium]|nr:CocE/NonD family hydrolase [Solirubrobacteraceae bacterium]
MTLVSETLARRMRLPRAMTSDVLAERDLAAAMDDGAVLLADRYVARATAHERQPTVLVRSPYGRRQAVGLIWGRLLAERGLQVVIQSARGTFGSQGEFDPFDERADGLATLRWVKQQPWHRGRIGMIGPSYLGLTQWAVAREGGDDLAALAIQVSASQFHGQIYAGESLSLESAASWLVMVAAQERRSAPLAMLRALRRLPALLAEVPLSELDARATGSPVGWFREGLSNRDRAGAYWVARDYAAGVGDVRAAVQLMGGWYDIFLPWMLEDYAALRAAGHECQLVIGPWTHTSPDLLSRSLQQGGAWLRAHLLGDERLLNKSPVRVFVTGQRSGGGWRELDTWPPPHAQTRLWPAAGGLLQERPPAEDDTADRYRYDPAHPTPSVGGPVLLTRRPVLDNRELESRADVLTYTTAPLSAPWEAIGPARVELHVRASSMYFDVFARVCDVDPQGASYNVCDGLVRVSPRRFQPAADGSVLVAFDLWPLAHRFAARHHVRLQVSSGAHPRYARNPGTGEDLLSATQLRAVEIELLRDADHPSALLLPS